MKSIYTTKSKKDPTKPYHPINNPDGYYKPIVIDPSDPVGMANYQAYQDSLYYANKNKPALPGETTHTADRVHQQNPSWQTLWRQNFLPINYISNTQGSINVYRPIFKYPRQPYEIKKDPPRPYVNINKLPTKQASLSGEKIEMDLNPLKIPVIEPRKPNKNLYIQFKDPNQSTRTSQEIIHFDDWGTYKEFLDALRKSGRIFSTSSSNAAHTQASASFGGTTKEKAMEIYKKYTEPKSTYQRGGIFKDPPVNPYAQGQNPLMPQTLASTNPTIKILPTTQELQKNQLDKVIQKDNSNRPVIKQNKKPDPTSFNEDDLKVIQLGLDVGQMIPLTSFPSYIASLPFTTNDVVNDLSKKEYKQAGLDALGYIPTFKAFKYGLKGDKVLDTSSKLAKQYRKINHVVNIANFSNDANQIKKQNGGWLNNYADGGEIEPEDPVNPIPSGVNVFATSNSIYRTPNNTTANKPVEYNPVYKSLAEKNFTKQELNAINNKKPDVLKQDRSIPKPKKLTPFEQKVLELEMEAQTLGQRKVGHNQFGEPVLQWDPTQPKASGKIEPDYMDPITMAATFGAGAYGLGYNLTKSLGIAANEALFNLPSLGKGIGKSALNNLFRPTSVSSSVDNVGRTNIVNSTKNQLSNALEGTSSVLQQITGELIQGKANRESIKKGNEWLQNWINHPKTKAKIDKDIDRANYFTQFLNDPSELDLLNVIREQSKNYKPNSKEYSLIKQFDQNLQQYLSKKSEAPIHQGNWGVSYRHTYYPEEIKRIEEGLKLPINDRYGSWISRTSKLSQNKRVSTTIHEGAHDWVSEKAFKKSGMRNIAIANMDPIIKKDFLEWESLIKKNINPETVMGKERAYQAYLANPTEQHARIMELRYDLNLTPDYKMDLDYAKKVLNWINKGGSMIDPKFLNVINNNPKKLQKLFNKFWSVSPYIGIGGAGALGAGALQQNKQEYGKGGLFKKKGGQMIKRADGSYSQRGLWDNIRANKGSGKKPTKQMLEQERKIKNK